MDEQHSIATVVFGTLIGSGIVIAAVAIIVATVVVARSKGHALRFVLFCIVGPIIGGSVVTVLYSWPAVFTISPALLVFGVIVTFVPALVPAFIAGLADQLLDEREREDRLHFVGLAGAGASLISAVLLHFTYEKMPIRFMAFAAVGGGLAAVACSWLFMRLRGKRRHG